MANTTIAGLTTITGANIATDDRFIVRDTSANTDLAITATELRNMIANAPIVLPTVISVNSSSTALRVTQTGTGSALLIEDAANPDSSPFIVTTAGDLGVGTLTPLAKVEISGGAAVGLRIKSDNGTPVDLVGRSADNAAQIRFLDSANTVSAIAGLVGTDFRIYTGGSNERIRITNTGFTGIGSIAPANRLHTIETSATTNATIFPMRVEAQTSGTPAIGIGTGIALATETATGNNIEIGATIEAVATNVTSAAENFDLVFRTMAAGVAAAERMRISSAGALTITGAGTFGGNVAVNGGSLTTTATTFNAVTTTATTVNAFSAATTLSLGYNSTLASTTNISTGATNSGVTKAINIGTGGVAGSTTTIAIGSSGGGTTTISSPTVALSTISSGTWNGSVISSTYGGTGVNNGGRTLTINTGNLTIASQAAGSSITLGGNISTANSVTTSGNFALTLTTTAATNVTLPTTGTLATLAGSETLTTKTINLTNNTLTGTLAQYNAAMSNGKFNGLTTPATFAPVAAAPGAVGFSESNTFAVVTPNATGTYTSTVPAAGVVCYLMVLTSGVTSFTLTFGTGFRSTGTLATGTVTAKYFTLAFVSDGTNLVEISRTAAT